LLYLLRAHEPELSTWGKGSTFAAVSKNQLSEIAIPIPFPRDPTLSLEIQHRIVSRIEALMAEVKRARELLKQMRNDIKRLMASILVEAFEDMPRNSLDWQEEPVSQFCHKPQYGYTESADWEPVGPKFLRITDIQDSKVNWDSVPYCPIPNGQLSRYLLASGDILFARSGATTGKTFLVQECPLAIFASYLIRLRIRATVRPDFLAWFFRSPRYWSQIQPRGAAQPNMNAKLLEEIKVCYPES
jgi:type I restriction enzyme, S subunit